MLHPVQLQPGEVLIETEATLLRPGSGSRLRTEAALGRIVATGGAVGGLAVTDRVLFPGGQARREIHAVPGPIQGISIVKVPDAEPSFDLLAAAALRRALRVRRCSAPPAGSWVVVMGLDLLGNLIAQLYRQGGARVLALSGRQDQVEIACAMGVPAFVHTDRASLKQLVQGPDCGRVHVAVAAGEGGHRLLDGLAVCRPHGQVLLLDPPDTVELDGTEFLRLVHFRCLRVKAVPSWEPPSEVSVEEAARAAELALREALDLLDDGGLNLPPVECIAPPDLPGPGGNLAPMAVMVDWRAS